MQMVNCLTQGTTKISCPLIDVFVFECYLHLMITCHDDESTNVLPWSVYHQQARTRQGD